MQNTVFVGALSANLWQQRRSAVQQRKQNSDSLQYAGNFRSNLNQKGEIFPSVSFELKNAHSYPDFVSSQKNNLKEIKKDPAAFSLWLKKAIGPHGEVGKLQIPSSGKFESIVIHIQDLHEVYEAQKNMAFILESLGKENDRLFVGLEAATGPFDLEPYRQFAESTVLQKTAETMLQQGMITGAEYFGMTTDLQPLLWGIESEVPYLENIQSFKDSLSFQKRDDTVIVYIRQEIEKLRKKIFSKETLVLDQKAEAFSQNSVDLGDYVSFLKKKKGSLSSWPQVALFYKALKKEKQLKTQQIKGERKALIKSLVQVLSPREMVYLTEKSWDYRLSRINFEQYFNHLKSLSGDHGLKISQYKNLADYVEYVIAVEKIDRGLLFDELEGLTKDLLSKSVKTKKERDLLSLTEDLRLLQKLNAFSLGHREWAQFKKNEERIRGLATRIENFYNGYDRIAEYKIGSHISSLMERHERFYKNAEDRNTYLIQNTLEKLNENKKEEGKAPYSVIVAGGFHSPGLKKLLLQENVGYVSVIPRVKTVQNLPHYLEFLSSSPTPLDRIFAGEKIFLHKPLVGAFSIPIGFLGDQFTAQGFFAEASILQTFFDVMQRNSRVSLPKGVAFNIKDFDEKFGLELSRLLEEKADELEIRAQKFSSIKGLRVDVPSLSVESSQNDNAYRISIPITLERGEILDRGGEAFLGNVSFEVSFDPDRRESSPESVAVESADGTFRFKPLERPRTFWSKSDFIFSLRAFAYSYGKAICLFTSNVLSFGQSRVLQRQFNVLNSTLLLGSLRDRPFDLRNHFVSLPFTVKMYFIKEIHQTHRISWAKNKEAQKRLESNLKKVTGVEEAVFLKNESTEDYLTYKVSFFDEQRGQQIIKVRFLLTEEPSLLRENDLHVLTSYDIHTEKDQPSHIFFQKASFSLKGFPVLLDHVVSEVFTLLNTPNLSPHVVHNKITTRQAPDEIIDIYSSLKMNRIPNVHLIDMLPLPFSIQIAPEIKKLINHMAEWLIRDSFQFFQKLFRQTVVWAFQGIVVNGVKGASQVAQWKVFGFKADFQARFIAGLHSLVFQIGKILKDKQLRFRYIQQLLKDLPFDIKTAILFNSATLPVYHQDFLGPWKDWVIEELNILYGDVSWGENDTLRLSLPTEKSSMEVRFEVFRAPSNGVYQYPLALNKASLDSSNHHRIVLPAIFFEGRNPGSPFDSEVFRTELSFQISQLRLLQEGMDAESAFLQAQNEIFPNPWIRDKREKLFIQKDSFQDAITLLGGSIIGFSPNDLYAVSVNPDGLMPPIYSIEGGLEKTINVKPLSSILDESRIKSILDNNINLLRLFRNDFLSREQGDLSPNLLDYIGFMTDEEKRTFLRTMASVNVFENSTLYDLFGDIYHSEDVDKLSKAAPFVLEALVMAGRHQGQLAVLSGDILESRRISSTETFPSVAETLLGMLSLFGLERSEAFNGFVQDLGAVFFHAFEQGVNRFKVLEMDTVLEEGNKVKGVNLGVFHVDKKDLEALEKSLPVQKFLQKINFHQKRGRWDTFGVEILVDGDISLSLADLKTKIIGIAKGHYGSNLPAGFEDQIVVSEGALYELDDQIDLDAYFEEVGEIHFSGRSIGSIQIFTKTPERFRESHRSVISWVLYQMIPQGLVEISRSIDATKRVLHHILRQA